MVYDGTQYVTCIVYFAVASRNNDRTVAGKSFAWRMLGMMPSLSKAATVLQTDEWRSERRAQLYHSCIDILAEQINDLTGRDMHFRFGDHKYRRSRVFLDFLSMDGDEVSTATMCPTTQCTSYWCPKQQLSDPDVVISVQRHSRSWGKICPRARDPAAEGWTAARSLQRGGMLTYDIHTYHSHISGIL